jgi:NAD(P)-dependent dehydrogenase (short-subunit alcohol dehydrogenase family)
LASSGTLAGKVAVVAGASRGCGRGLAVALGSAGATVYVTGRTGRNTAKPVDGAPGTVEETAGEVTARGGQGIPVLVDHTDPKQVVALFERIHREHGQIDVLACAVWGGNERYLDESWKRNFWEQPAEIWQECMGAGPYAFWLAARASCRFMAQQRSGLVVAISEPDMEQVPDGYQSSVAESFSHLAHHSINRLVVDLGVEAHKSGIAIVGLLPGFMRTERVEMHLESMGDGARESLRYDLSESTEYAGRAVVALATDPDVLEKSGKLLYVADLAGQYDFTDTDGKQVANFYRVLGIVR